MIDEAWLFRPCLADPPLCTYTDIVTRLTLDDVADMNELLELRQAVADKAAKAAAKGKKPRSR